MLTEEDLTRRLHDAASRIDVDVPIESIVDGVVTPIVAPRRRHRGVLVAAAACVVIAITAAVVAGGRHEPAWTPPATVPAAAPTPGSLAPEVADAPAWLGELVPGRRPGAERDGTWVSTAIARPTADGYESPIVVSSFDGTWSALADAAPVTIDGRTYVAATFGDVELVAAFGTPSVVASGAVDRSVLASIVAGTDTHVVDGVDTLRLTARPASYVEIVPPTRLGEDVADRRTLAETGGRLAINEVSDHVDALLAAAGTGAALHRVVVAGGTGWSGTAPTTSALMFLVWSPRPGVVFELDSTDPSRTVGELVDLASRTTAIPTADWDQRHPG